MSTLPTETVIEPETHIGLTLHLAADDRFTIENAGTDNATMIVHRIEVNVRRGGYWSRIGTGRDTFRAYGLTRRKDGSPGTRERHAYLRWTQVPEPLQNALHEAYDAATRLAPAQLPAASMTGSW